MADSIEAQTSLQMQPTISIWCTDHYNRNFPVSIWNPSYVHAKVLAQATVTVNGQALVIPPGLRFSAEKVWKIQALGPNCKALNASLNVEHILTQNGLPPTLQFTKAVIFLDIWVANLSVRDEEIKTAQYQNPRLQWDWDSSHGVWQQEIAPD